MFAIIRLVCTENSGSHVVVTQPAGERMRRDATDPLDRAREWRVFNPLWLDLNFGVAGFG
jgi:hypothetical protein